MKIEVGRVAFRAEGDWWNAYWAPSQTSMEGAVHLGSVRLNLAHDDRVKATFMDAMKAAFAVAAKDALGEVPIWGGVKPAPENERSGSA